MTAASGTPRPRVVCVDDDASIRRFVGLVLEELPVDFVPCADAAAARAALREAPAALLITDLMMPGESGFDLLASLAADPALRGPAQLAVFSAGLNAGTRSRLDGLGVAWELSKPVSVQALEDCVRAAIGGEPPPAPPAAARTAAAPDDDRQRTIDERFGGDAVLYDSFRAHALHQFVVDRQQLAQSLVAADWPALRRHAHSLKGALALLGDDDGSSLARGLEDAAAAGEAEACRRSWPALDAHLSRLVAS